MRKTVAVISFVLALLFIWIQSSLPPHISSAESGFVMRLVQPLLELIVGKGNVTQHLVRKLAHFTEFAVLGFISVFFYYSEDRKWYKKLFISIITCLLIAVIDETIQIFTNRGPAILDVWIDTSGATFGALIGLIF